MLEPERGYVNSAVSSGFLDFIPTPRAFEAAPVMTWCVRLDLHKPHRCTLPENGDEARVARETAQAFQRFKNRKVGLADAVVFDTLPRHKPKPHIGRHPREKRVNDGGLSYSRFPSEKHNLPLPLQEGR